MAEINFGSLWFAVWVEAKERHGLEENFMSYDREVYHDVVRDAFRGYLVRIYREKWREEYQGLPLGDIDPLVIRIVQLHHWSIKDAMGLDELEQMVALADELSHFKIPEEAVRAAYSDVRGLPYPEWHVLLESHRPDDMEELPT